MGLSLCRLIGVLLLAASAFAQVAGTVNFNLAANYPTAKFWVDGKEYTGAATFVWPLGSKHTIQVLLQHQSFNEGNSALDFQDFADPNGLLQDATSATQIYTASTAIPTMTVRFTLMHRMELRINKDPLQNLVDPTSPGYAPMQLAELPLRASQAGYMIAASSKLCATNRLGIPASTWTWFADSENVPLNAIPYPGYAFTGWESSEGPLDPYLAQWAVTGPEKLTAKFVAARRFYVDSWPVRELKVVVDQNFLYTRGTKCQPDLGIPAQDPATSPVNVVDTQTVANFGYCAQIPLCNGHLDFAPGTKHVFAAPNAQTDNQGQLWVFDHWEFNDGTTGKQNAEIEIPSTDGGVTAGTAYFVKGVKAIVGTVPSGLPVTVDGRNNWLTPSFEWGVGHKHVVSAPAELTDAKGRRYRFLSWSNGGPAEQEIVVPDDGGANPGSFVLYANYEALSQLVVRSEPEAVKLRVGTAECVTPCTLDRPAGTQVAIAAPAETVYTEDSKGVFSAWSDGLGSTGRNYTFGNGAAALVVRYRTLNKLTVYTDPEGSVNWTFDPAAEAGGYYAANTRVQVTAEAKPGYKFKRFEGALTGTYNTGAVVLSQPQYLAAHMTKVAALEETAVRNAAGVTPDAVVAPGSLIAIQGYNLVPEAQVGPDSPLAQTLQGLIVQQAYRYLPLLWVSPETVVAQLPSDVAAGEQTLTVRPAGQAAVTAKFTVARNAPGLFKQPGSSDDVPYALAYHADGTMVTVSAPAKPGETVTLYATGLGPVDPAPLDGFAAPLLPAMPLKDTAELWSGGLMRKLTFAGVAPGRVGFQILKFPVDAAWGSAKLADVTVKVNGRTSNKVLLPLQ